MGWWNRLDWVRLRGLFWGASRAERRSSWIGWSQVAGIVEWYARVAAGRGGHQGWVGRQVRGCFGVVLGLAAGWLPGGSRVGSGHIFMGKKYFSIFNFLRCPENCKFRQPYCCINFYLGSLSFAVFCSVEFLQSSTQLCRISTELHAAL